MNRKIKYTNTMVEPKIFLRSLVLFLLRVFCYSPVGSFSATEAVQEETYQITSEQLSSLEIRLEQLAVNNRELLNRLDESTQELETANESSANLARECELLRTELTASLEKIDALTSELEKLKKDSKQVRNSLEIANNELENASKYFKQYEKQRDREANILRNQRNIWEGIAAVLGVGLIYSVAH